MSSLLNSSKRKSEPIITSGLPTSGGSSSNSSGSTTPNGGFINKLLSKSGSLEKSPQPPPSDTKPKRPLSLSIGDVSPSHSPPSPLNRSGNASPPSSTSISPSSSQLSLKSNFKMPPKSNSVIFSSIYDKTNGLIENIDEDDLFQRTNIQKLLLGRNKLEYLSERISELVKLTVIDVSNNRLKSLPLQISQLTELTTLNLSGNKFMISSTKENEEILNNSQNNSQNNNGNPEDSLPNLSLNSVDESLNYLPWEISFLQNLKKLDLSYNQCRDENWEGENLLPNSIFWFTQIETLLIQGCQLKSISPDIQHLESLTHLDISSNSLNELPLEISNLYRLKHLNCSFNKIKLLPDTLYQLSESLVHFDCSNNLIEQLPESLSSLTYLQNFNISNNQIKILPESLFPGYVEDNTGLYSLITFKARCNQFESLPNHFFTTIKDIRNLDLSMNKLSVLSTDGLKEIENLSTLLLFNNQLNEIPTELFESIGDSDIKPNLVNLNLSGNRIKVIPINLWKCKSLSHLSLGYNLIRELEFPLDIGSFYSLEELYLNGNPLLEFKLSKNSNDLFPALRDLSLSSCSLNEIPSFIPSSCKNLEKFDFSYNSLTNLKAISSLEHLQILLLSNNSISNLDSNLLNLKNLILVDLSMNPLNLNHDLQSTIMNLSDSLFIVNQTNIDSNNFKLLEEYKNIHISKILNSSRFEIYYSDMIGRRPTMEDSFSIHGSFMGQSNMDLISLFDGHAGQKAATFSSENFPVIMKNLISKFPSIPPLQWLKQAYSETNLSFRNFINQDTTRQELKYCGATAASILIYDDYYCVSNIGDTRVVLCQDGKAIRLSFDHKPGDPGETRRINKLGGFVITNQHTSRVNGTLALSRSIGDFYMEPYVISDPYLSQTKRNLELDQFIIIACDGIWDEISDQQACDIVLSSNSLKEASNRLKDFAYFSGSDDNISVILIDLKKIK